LRGKKQPKDPISEKVRERAFKVSQVVEVKHFAKLLKETKIEKANVAMSTTTKEKSKS
jgi:hypothetical protein